PERRHLRLAAARIMSVFGGETASDVETGKFEPDAVAHPVSRGKRTFIGVGILDLAADMKAQADPVADPMCPLRELDRIGRSSPELLRQLIGCRAPGSYAHIDGHRPRIDV